MDVRYLAAAASGAVVSAAFLQSYDRFSPSPEAAETDAPSATAVIIGKQEAARSNAFASTKPVTAHTVEQLTKQLELAKMRMKEQEFAAAMARGQLLALQGEPSLWPDAPRPAHTPRAVEAAMATLAENHPDITLSHVRCDEYPCLVRFEFHAHDDDPPDKWWGEVSEAFGTWAKGQETPGSLTTVARTLSTDIGFGPRRFVVLAAHEGDDAVQVRTSYRADGLLEEVTEHAADGL